MPKISLTKNELKIQKDTLKRFNRYLPMLQLKKQQLQIEIIRIDGQIRELDGQIKSSEQKIDSWVDVFAEEAGLANLFKLAKVNTDLGNIAGMDIPLFKSAQFEQLDYDYISVPLWVDYAIDALKQIMVLKVQALVFKRQQSVLREELRITTQRVNLFEKVKIPEAIKNIGVIQIHLGDLQTANVVRGKIAKAKIEEKQHLLSV